MLGPIPDGRDWYYQKHMAIHMLEEVDLSWMMEMRNCFLIRHPAEVIVSMSRFRALVPKTKHVVDEFEDYLKCGRLEHGFLRFAARPAITRSS